MFRAAAPMWFPGLFIAETRHLWNFSKFLSLNFVSIILRKWISSLVEKGRYKGQCFQVEELQSKERHVPISLDSIDWNCYGGIRTYSLEELQIATEDFSVRIGVGATSFVYLAVLGDGRLGAVKRVMEERGGSKKMFVDEVSVMLRISHPNLVVLIGFCLEKGEQLMLLEYVPNRTLFDRLHTSKGQAAGILSWSNRLSIALDVSRALDFLHSKAKQPIIHRDVKSSNVLLIDNNHAKLGDFGLCKVGYHDRVQVETGRVTSKSDVYGFGILLLELITGLKSIQGSVTLAEWTRHERMNKNESFRIGILDPKLEGEVNIEQLRYVISIANSALIENPQERPNMSQIVESLFSCINTEYKSQLSAR